MLLRNKVLKVDLDEQIRLTVRTSSHAVLFATALCPDAPKGWFFNGLLKTDPYHAFPDVIDNLASSAAKTQLKSGASRYQVEGSLNGAAGRFEWIIQDGNVTHRVFVPGGTMNGVPIKP